VTGAAIVLFWPAAFFVKGDGQNAAELARLKGEFEAIEQASISEELWHPLSATRTSRDKLHR
jgi:hypothetical protein